MTAGPATGSALEEALALHDRGWNVVPMDGKRPHPDVLKAVHGHYEWLPLRDRRASAVEVAAWFDIDPAAGLGLIVPPGHVVVDVDKPSLFGHRHPPTPTVATSRGFHLHFAGDVQGVHDFPWGEVRGGGSIVVLPPSRHPDTGVAYEWRIGLDEVEMAPLPEALNPSINHREEPPNSIGTIGPSESDGAEPNLSADDWAVSRVFAYLGRPRALNPQTGRATTFRCLLPKHTDADPSAAIFRSKDSGTWRYVCFSCGAWLSMARLYAAIVSGTVDRDDELPTPAAARWLRRLWHDAGVAPVELLHMPEPDGPREVRQVAEGFRLLASVRLALGDTDPVPFSTAFAAAWTGLPVEVAEAALKELRRQKWLRPLGKSKPGVGFLYPLELPPSEDAAASVPVDVLDVRPGPLEATGTVVVVEPQHHLGDFGAVDGAHVVACRGRTVTPVRCARPPEVSPTAAHTPDFTPNRGVANTTKDVRDD